MVEHPETGKGYLTDWLPGKQAPLTQSGDHQLLALQKEEGTSTPSNGHPCPFLQSILASL